MDLLRALLAFVGKLFRKGGPTVGPPTPARTPLGIEHHVWASSFADPADVRAFRKWYAIYKTRGFSDEQARKLAFGKGDDGIGFFGDDTTSPVPMCALPPEDLSEKWGSVGAAKHKPVQVYANDRDVTCIVGDRMPHRANIENGAGIDLSPAAVAALNLTPPVMVRAVWHWLS